MGQRFMANDKNNKNTSIRKRISKRADKYATTITTSVFFIFALLLCIGLHFEYKDELRIKKTGTEVTAHVTSVQSLFIYKEDSADIDKYTTYIEWEYEGKTHSASLPSESTEPYFKVGDKVQIVVDRNDGGKWCTTGDSGHRYLIAARIFFAFWVVGLVYSIIYDIRKNKNEK